MLFNSIEFLAFFPATALICFLLPRKARNIWLLAASYFFYGCFNISYVFLLLGVTLITYGSGLMINRTITTGEPIEKARIWVAASFVINLLLLCFFKYTNFIIGSIRNLLGNPAEPGSTFLNIILPIGISFYIFQALGYVVDVYRKKISAEKNIINYGLFVSFFPQLASGPIGRATSLLPQIAKKPTFTVDNARRGLLEFCWGAFLKLMIADRAAILVNTVYADHNGYSGLVLLVAAICYSFQIYCDFASYSYMALGCGRILGFNLIQNFNTPYFAVSITDFWRRWHISLSSWFRDYLYIPLGGSRKGTLRKHLNTMIVFLASGLWHGANWTFVVWGGLNGAFQVIGNSAKALRMKVCKALGCDPENMGNRFLKIVFTFLLITVTWVFFRATSITQAFEVLTGIVTDFRPWELWTGELLKLGLTGADMVVMIASLLVLLGVSLSKAAGKDVIGNLLKQGLVFRWAIYLLLIFTILIFGVYGAGYDAASFIYFQF